MESLTALSPLPPLGQVFPAPMTPSPDRDSVSDQPASQLRPVTLSGSRVDASDTSHATRQAPNTVSGTEAKAAGLSGSHTESRGPKLEHPDLSAAGIQAHNRGVTYKLHPDLSIRFQGQVIDRSTTEPVRTIPNDARIESARRYQRYIGSQIDFEA